MARLNWAQKLKNLIDKNPVTILIVISVFFISSFFTIIQGIGWSIDYYNNKINWKQREYEKLNTLRAGMNQDKFKEKLGLESYVRSTTTGYTERVYRNQSYWVQTIASSSGEVAFYSITSCEDRFQYPVQPNPLNKPIILNNSTFFDIEKENTNFDYFISGATANSYFYEYFGSGNPYDYKTVAIGINDICPFKDIPYPDTYKDLKSTDPEVIQFRKKATINTYAETAPFIDIEQVTKELQIGVDIIQIRSLL